MGLGAAEVAAAGVGWIAERGFVRQEVGDEIGKVIRPVPVFLFISRERLVDGQQSLGGDEDGDFIGCGRGCRERSGEDDEKGGKQKAQFHGVEYF